jgi:hypothetical protein
MMALGSADGFEGSVSFGNVLNSNYNDDFDYQQYFWWQ